MLARIRIEWIDGNNRRCCYVHSTEDADALAERLSKLTGISNVCIVYNPDTARETMTMVLGFA